MILHEVAGGSEQHPTYRTLEIDNGDRHYSFLQSMVRAAFEVDRPFLSQTVIKAINFHAIACLHAYAGEHRPCEVSVGDFTPPEHYRVGALMDDFVNIVNRRWTDFSEVELAAFVLWRLNYIHPFVNGNGRTARAAAYFVLCLKLGGWPDTPTILPELLRDPKVRAICVDALKQVDESASQGKIELSALIMLLEALLQEQLSET